MATESESETEAALAWTSFPALRAHAAQRSAEQLRQQEDVLVEGQLVHSRRVSRKCVFFDLASASDGETGERLEVVLKIIDDELALEQVEAIRHRVKLGDVVRVRGFLEHVPEAGSLLLHARDMVAVRPWKLLHPGETFMPSPVAPARSNGSGGGRSRSEHCKFWINSRTCQLGDRCELRHERDADALKRERAAWLAQRLRLKRERAALAADPQDPHGKMSKALRAKALCDWLEATFGVEQLSAGRGVLDIAGGRGDVAFELWNRRGIPCTLIDPRPRKLSRAQFKHFKQLETPKEDVASMLSPQLMTRFDAHEFLEDGARAALAREASLLVGMHPDEATDAIVDVALRLDKPFAVVPCCVFAQTFPDRRRPGGQRVTSFDDLIAYLLAKAPDVRRAFLPMDGKNMVLYRLPRDGN